MDDYQIALLFSVLVLIPLAGWKITGMVKKLQRMSNRVKEESKGLTSTEKEFNETLDLLKKIKFINSFSFIFSPRPGTKAAKLEMINKEITKERLIIIQKKLFNNQFELNQSMKNSLIEVLVENKLKNQNKYFGRNKYLSSVIFNGDEKKIGKLIKVKIEECNQNSLFGKIEKNNMRAA